MPTMATLSGGILSHSHPMGARMQTMIMLEMKPAMAEIFPASSKLIPSAFPDRKATMPAPLKQEMIVTAI